MEEKIRKFLGVARHVLVGKEEGRDGRHLSFRIHRGFDPDEGRFLKKDFTLRPDLRPSELPPSLAADYLLFLESVEPPRLCRISRENNKEEIGILPIPSDADLVTLLSRLADLLGRSAEPRRLEVLWEHRVPVPLHSTPAAMRDRVFVCADQIYCLDAENGRVLWSQKGWTDASAVRIGDRLLVGTGSGGEAFCLSISDGKVHWRRPLGGEIVASASYLPDRAVFASTSGVVAAFRMNSGEPIWKRQVGSAVRAAGSGPDSGGVWLGTDSGACLCLDKRSGEEVGRFQAEGRILAEPTAVRGLRQVNDAFQRAGIDEGVLLSTEEGWVYLLTADAKPVWSRKLKKGVLAAGCVMSSHVYVGCLDHCVYALDLTTGEVAWSFASTGWIQSAPEIFGGVLYVGSDDGFLYGLDPTAGTFLGKWALPGGLHGRPVFAGDRAYFACANLQLDSGVLACCRWPG